MMCSLVYQGMKQRLCDKDYKHTISRDILNIKIEPVAWNSEDGSTVDSINAFGSIDSIPQVG